MINVLVLEISQFDLLFNWDWLDITELCVNARISHECQNRSI